MLQDFDVDESIFLNKRERRIAGSFFGQRIMAVTTRVVAERSVSGGGRQRLCVGVPPRVDARLH